MLHDDRIRVIHDYIRADDVFPGVEIKGGVCYFLWDRDNRGLCQVYTHMDGRIVSNVERPLLEEGADCFIRHNGSVSILRKVLSKHEPSFSDIVSSRKPFGFPTNFTQYKTTAFSGAVKILANQEIGYVERDAINVNTNWIDKYKIFMPEAIGVGNVKTDLLKPILGEPNTCSTETYLILGTYDTKQEAENAISYISTKFFHLLLSLKKVTQHTTKSVYQFVPMQDFSEPWTDEKLYAKYGLTQDEIAFIESMVRPMEIGE
jgi:site-specific DNA-methyltransferase (adenine-specific)